MLWNSFYKIDQEQSAPGYYSGRVHFVANHEIFAGHFPGQPVVPGVCMMDMVQEQVERGVGSPLWLKKASQVKFLQMLLPDSQPILELKWEKGEGNQWKVQATIKENQGTMFRLQGIYVEMLPEASPADVPVIGRP